MLEALKHDLAERFEGVEMSRIVIGAAGSGLSEEEEREWTDTLKEAFPDATVYYNPLSFSIGSHTGPGAVGTAISVRREY